MEDEGLNQGSGSKNGGKGSGDKNYAGSAI